MTSTVVNVSVCENVVTSYIAFQRKTNAGTFARTTQIPELQRAKFLHQLPLTPLEVREDPGPTRTGD
jgi:hypothetical protein